MLGSKMLRYNSFASMKEYFDIVIGKTSIIDLAQDSGVM
jgi:hypothetical protein